MIDSRIAVPVNNFHRSIYDMKVDDLNELLSVVTTRPQHTLQCTTPGWPRGGDSIYLRYAVRVPNTYHPEQMLDLAMHQDIPGFVRTVEDFYDYCLAICLWFDEHEGRESFKVNGRPWRDPHRPSFHTFIDHEAFDRVRAMRPPSGLGFPY